MSPDRCSGGAPTLSRVVVVAWLLVSAAVRPLHAQTTSSPAAPAAPTDQTFDIGEFRVLGNHVLPAIKIEAAVYPFLGPDRTLKDVEKARDALVAAYRDLGFGTVLVDIPEQSVEDGVVRLKVTEGRIEKIRISGARYYSDRHILAALPAIKPGTVPELPALQSELSQLANESRDRQITPILKAGTEPGTVAVDLRVQDKLPVHGSVSVDNRHTADTTPIRLTGSLSYDNLFQRGESLSVQYQTAPAAPSEVKLYVLTYAGRTASPDWTWQAYGIRSDSDVAALGTLDVVGNGWIFGGRLVRSFSSAGGALYGVSFGLDYKDFGQNILLTNDTNSATPIHYLLGSVQLTAGQSSAHFEASSSLALNVGMDGLESNFADFAYKRYGSTGSFAYLHGGANVTWHTWAGFALNGRLGFQYAAEPLITNEQFSLGGVDSVRGYLEAEELVDSGVAGTIELRAPPLTRGKSALVFHVFYDRGYGMNLLPLPSEISSGLVRSDLASFGAGFHATLFSELNANLDWADPRLNGSRTLEGKGRVQFSVLYGF